MNPNVELHIDQLILQGFSRNDAHYIGESMKAALQGLIANRGLPNTFQKNIQLRNLNTSPLQLKQTSSPEHIGRQIANSVYKEISINTATSK